MAKTPESRSKSFLFRDLNLNILIGTASDRYAGWIGQDSKKCMAHKLQFNLIINNRAGGNAPMIAQKIAERLHSEQEERLF